MKSRKNCVLQRPKADAKLVAELSFLLLWVSALTAHPLTFPLSHLRPLLLKHPSLPASLISLLNSGFRILTPLHLTHLTFLTHLTSGRWRSFIARTSRSSPSRCEALEDRSRAVRKPSPKGRGVHSHVKATAKGRRGRIGPHWRKGFENRPARRRWLPLRASSRLPGSSRSRCGRYDCCRR